MDQQAGPIFSCTMWEVGMSDVRPAKRTRGMETYKGFASYAVSETVHSPLLCGEKTDVGGSDRHKWEEFECVFRIPKTGYPWYTLSLGQGNWQKIQHGAFPRFSGPLSPEVPLVKAVVPCWRGVHSGYWIDKVKCQIRLQVLGEVAVVGQPGDESFTREKAILLKSWLAVASHYVDVMAVIDIQSGASLGKLELASSGRY